MRSILSIGLILVLSAPATAQAKRPPIEITQQRIGFGSYRPEDGRGRYKVGLWTPVYVKIKAGPNGIRPKVKDEPPYVQVKASDSEDVETIFRTPFTMEPNEERWIMTYARPGNLSNVEVTARFGEITERPPLGGGYTALDLNTHLYLTLGERIPDLQTALRPKQPQQPQNQRFPGQQDEFFPRYAAFATDVAELPDMWFGYQGVDLMFLSTRDKDFLLELGKDNDASRARLRSISQWVRRGGHLVIHIAPRNSDVLNQVLQSTVWQPPVPVVPPREGNVEVDRLNEIEQFARATKKLEGQFKLAQLQPAKMLPGSWEVLATATDAKDNKHPVLTRMPYGLGSITYVAFPLDDAPFRTWDGRAEFLHNLLARLAPRINNQIQEHEHVSGSQDLSTGLKKNLDQFDIRVIPFGYVALFIILYIIVVGPLDFLLLKYVFKRLEWTWFTFPTVVIVVSVAAYYTAYAIKGDDLKINKVDVVDIDLRTNLDATGATKKASIYGNTFFTILSPRIQNYTVGIEPNSAFWGQQADDTLSADMITWFGYAEIGFGGMGRGGGQGFFRKPYHYTGDASGLREVPIPVWTTKSFHASWEVQGVAPPLDADLRYFQRPVDGKDLHVGGKLTSKLPVDLDNAWLIYMDHAYPIDGGLPRGATIDLALENNQKRKLSEWAAAAGSDGQRINTAQGSYNPGHLSRQLLFNDRLANIGNLRNHALRALDLSWRLQEDTLKRDQGLREAILVARTKFAHGAAESLSGDVNQPLPTHVWLGALPGDGVPRPAMAGILAQDTFVRVIIPLKAN